MSFPIVSSPFPRSTSPFLGGRSPFPRAGCHSQQPMTPFPGSTSPLPGAAGCSRCHSQPMTPFPGSLPPSHPIPCHASPSSRAPRRGGGDPRGRAGGGFGGRSQEIGSCRPDASGPWIREAAPGGMRLPVSLWLPLALGVAAVAAVAAGQSPLQRRVVRDVLEYFHGRSNVHFLFKERDVDGVIEREDASGTFVQLRLGLAQTTCRKRAPQRHCRVLESRRKPTCLACYKFDNSDVPKVLDKYQNCGPSHHLTAKEIRQRDEAECRAVEEAGKGGDIQYLPGMFAFSRGLPA